MTLDQVSPVTVPTDNGKVPQWTKNEDPSQVAEGFESLFLSMLMKPLEKSEAYFGSGPGGRTFGGMFTQQLADSVASTRPLGIANQIEQSLVARARAAESYGRDAR